VWPPEASGCRGGVGAGNNVGAGFGTGENLAPVPVWWQLLGRLAGLGPKELYIFHLFSKELKLVLIQQLTSQARTISNKIWL
jgi:hypothetical protein